MTRANARVIFDTNVWISFLIGKQLSTIQEYLSNGKITVVYTSLLLTELEVVSKRKKLRKYFPEAVMAEFISLLKAIGENVEIEPVHFVNRDPKDNFLFDPIDFSKADFLVTGDKDLLEHKSFKTAKILTPRDFAPVIRNF